MKKSVTYFLSIIILVLLVCCGTTTAFAAEEAPVDYKALFNRIDEVDGYLAESYFLEVNQAFDASPLDFVAALSEQPFERIVKFSVNIAYEHHSQIDSHRSLLATMLENARPDSTERDTLILMDIGVLRAEAGRNIDPDHFENTFHSDVNKHYEEQRQLLLNSLCNNGPQVYEDFADALIYQKSADEVTALKNQLSADAEAPWADDDTRAAIDQLLDQIDESLTPPNTGTEPTDPAETTPTAATTTTPTEPATNEQKPAKNDLTVPLIIAAVILIGAAGILLMRRSNRK